jgi:hypothetical protein
MKKKEQVQREKPYIDYKTADVMARMYDFIVDSEELREKVNRKLLGIIRELQMFYDDLNPIQEEKRKYFAIMGHIDPIDRLRHDSWEMGLTDTCKLRPQRATGPAN